VLAIDESRIGFRFQNNDKSLISSSKYIGDGSNEKGSYSWIMWDKYKQFTSETHESSIWSIQSA